MTTHPTHDDDLVLFFEADQGARHAAVLRLNEMAKAMVERAKAKAAGQQPDEDGEIAGPGRLRIVLGFDREDKSSKQRRFLHGPVLGQISEQASVGGIRYAMPVWKEHLRAMFLGFTWESVRYPGQKRATPRKVRISTESLSVKQYSDYLDKVLAYAASELGVVFDLDPIERESVRYARPKRTKQPEAETA